MLRKVQIADPDSVMHRYPHQLSGGMQQRVVIAMALATDPTLLILDEPTTGLDATVEAEVLDLVRGLRSEFGTSILFISHNLGVIASMCDRIGVLYAGELVEEGPSQQILHDPRHPYSVGLLRCIPRPGARKDQGRLDTIPGFLPQLGAVIPGCVFADRCALAQDICVAEKPPLYDLGGRLSRCHFHEKAQELPRETSSKLDIPRTLRPHADSRAARRVARQDVPAVRTRRARARRCQRIALARRDARPRRRVGLRQDDVRADAARHRRADRRHRRARRARAAGPARQAQPGRRARRADRLPEPRLGAQPASLDPQAARPHAQEARGHLRQGGRGAHARAHAGRAARRPLPERAPDPALGRPEAARRDRARVRRLAARRRLRRADLGARRLGAGRHPQPARTSCRSARTSPTSSSRTTSASCATSPTASRCSTSGA